MECRRCWLRLRYVKNEYLTSLRGSRSFHSSPRFNRLGAATYAQEWKTGTYHYNKQTTKSLPVAAATVDKLFQAYATMRRSRAPLPEGSDPEDRKAEQKAAKLAIAAQRLSAERLYVGASTAKDFGNKVVVSAFVFDGKRHAEIEEEKRRNARMGEKSNEQQQQQQRRGGGGRRRVGRSPGSGGVEGS